MPDFSIDYSALHVVQTKMHDLADAADSGGATGTFKEVGEASASERKALFGSSDLSYAFNLFYSYSTSRTKDAKDGLGQLADTFAGVADTFFNADAQLSSAAGLMSNSLGLDEWKNDKEAYDSWQEDKTAWDDYLERIGASEYFEEHPDADIGDVCRADDAPGFCETWLDDDDAPDDPGSPPTKPSDDPPTSYTYEDEQGKVSVEVELDDDYNVMKETSTITTTDGQSYTSVTTYDSAPRIITPEEGDPFDARDYTMVTTYGDGTESTTEVVINDDGSGTMTTTDPEGEVTTVSRSGPDEEWPEPEDDED
ncbi:serine/arginine repetitive matrix protein 2 [Streptomyces sp. CRN 30]|uniref:serine/arginine repetitive matrix protein 2 n=1 Tax=Streptomyces sp. CRN 30 TaxID=3075613 RepID=UPI002A81F171|nr:serine/arginine repetitive matrix protein 2 [Streptomyces sp. CRN 30]